MREYLVIGVYEDNQQPFSEKFEALGPRDAADMARARASQEETSDLIVAAVLLEGEIVL